MGKDQELLEAARTGNLQAVKTILSGKLPRTTAGSSGLAGGLRSLLALKPVNLNCIDTNGETPLHLAALHGHRLTRLSIFPSLTKKDFVYNEHCFFSYKDVVQALLAAKASVVELDSKGCTPLHLAAWNGHADICNLLLQHTSDKSIVNVQTNEGETPLHFAAQHGHLEVVTLLLQNKADPTCRTLFERSALDLAAQYGKKDVVRTLVTGRPELLSHFPGQPSPLHLAAFNGHLAIVSFLLDSGFPVNTRTENGTALHEAATSCKLDVIKLLLDRGVDVGAKATNGMTAEDILNSISSQRTKEALQIINGHINSQRTPDSDGEKDINGIPGPGGSQGAVTPPGERPVPKPRSIYIVNHPDSEQYCREESSKAACGNLQSPPPPVPPRMSLRQIESSKRDSMPVVETEFLHLEHKGHPRSRESSPMSGNREQPRKPPRKTPSVRKNADHVESSISENVPCDSTCCQSSDYVNIDLLKMGAFSMSLYSSSDDGEAAVVRPSVDTETEGEVIPLDDSRKESQGFEEGVTASSAEIEEKDSDRVTNVKDEETKSNKPQSLELTGGRKRVNAETDAPLSPTHYAQPPTPDCPPPSPSTALQGIQQKINPQDKRKSKDMETITETNLLIAPALPAEGRDLSSISSSDSKDCINDNVTADVVTCTLSHDEQLLSQGLETVNEESSGGDKSIAIREKKNTENVIGSHIPGDDADGGDNAVEVLGEVVQMRRSLSGGNYPVDLHNSVFAGLLKGSSRGGSRNVVSQICENVAGKAARPKRRSTPVGSIPFDPLMEEDKDVFDADKIIGEIDRMTIPPHSAATESSSRKSEDSFFDDSEEWAKIAATLETFGAGIARESVFVREYEPKFAKALAAGSHKIQSVGEWLESFGLGQYENTLVANGFDDTDFLGGNIVEDQDLTAIGISNTEHRSAIVSAAKHLPPVHPVDQSALPATVDSWLESLRLEQYMDNFVSHKYTTMERVIKLWELELNTVLDISSIGHRKRILASLGERPPPDKDSSLSPARVRKHSTEDEPKSPFEHIDLYRDYTSVRRKASENGDQRSPPLSPFLTFDKGGDNGLSSPQRIRDSQIHIRPPHLMHMTGTIKQWRHKPEVLIKGCCNYTAFYLGSTIVKELKGTTTTQEGIAKMKKSTEVISKIPTILLSISYKGVKFIDAKSKNVICDHEIANIFCACQDGDNMNFFAYVTKDKETNKHYCHVFSARNRELAGEIILTLGEAFEIAYQIVLKERAEEDAFQFERQLSQSDQDDSTSISSKASINTV